MRFVFLLIASALFSASAWPYSVLQTTKITQLENGWYGEGVVVTTSGAGVGGCAGANNEFALESAHPGYETTLALLMSAQAQNANVVLVVQIGSCSFGQRTRLVSVRLLN